MLSGRGWAGDFDADAGNQKASEMYCTSFHEEENAKNAAEMREIRICDARSYSRLNPDYLTYSNL